MHNWTGGPPPPGDAPLLLLLCAIPGLDGDTRLASIDELLISLIILCVRLTWPSDCELAIESSCGDGIICWSWDGLKLPITGVNGAELSAKMKDLIALEMFLFYLTSKSFSASTLTTQQHLLQQVVDVRDAKQLGELDLLDHLPCDRLQHGQNE